MSEAVTLTFTKSENTQDTDVPPRLHLVAEGVGMALTSQVVDERHAPKLYDGCPLDAIRGCARLGLE